MIYGAFVQDNPFEVSEKEEGSTTRGNTDAGSGTKAEGKVFELTSENERSKDPQTPAELAQAISSLIDVEAWADARVYLNQLSKVVMNDKELYDLYTERGAEFFYILHSVEQLSPDSQRLAKRVLSAAKNYATSDARIRNLVKTLADPNINVRSTALRKIKQVGPQGYAAMLEVFGDEKLKDLWPGVHLGTNEAIDLISFLYLSPNTPQNVKTFAERRLRVYFGGSIDRSSLVANLSRKANQNLRGQRKNTSSNARVKVWQYQAASNKFESNRVSPAGFERPAKLNCCSKLILTTARTASCFCWPLSRRRKSRLVPTRQSMPKYC